MNILDTGGKQIVLVDIKGLAHQIFDAAQQSDRYLLVYREGNFSSDQIVCIDDQNPYFKMIHSTWGQRLREVFEAIVDPVWDGGAAVDPLVAAVSPRYEPLRKITSFGDLLKSQQGK